MALKLRPMELISLVLMLIPGLALVGVILYFLTCGGARGKKLIIMLLSILFGFIASIFLWLNALGVINL